ncbi:MAG: tetratricopeptide repeat protein [Chthoniobacterales bacterium]
MFISVCTRLFLGCATGIFFLTAAPAFSQDRVDRYYLRTLEAAPESWEEIQKFMGHAKSLDDEKRAWFVEKFSGYAKDDLRWYLPLAALFLEKGTPDGLKEAENSLQIFSENFLPVSEGEITFLALQFRVALQKARSGDAPDAIANLQKNTEQLLSELPYGDPLWLSVWLEVFSFAEEKQNTEFAQQIIDQAMPAAGEALPAGIRRPLSTWFIGQENFPAAQEIWESLRKSKSPDERFEAQRELASIAATEGDLPRALDLLAKAVSLVSAEDFRRSELYVLAESYTQDQPELRQEFLRYLLGQTPQDVAAWLALAESYEQDSNQQVSLLQTALENNPANPQLQYALLDALDQQGNAAAALTLADEILKSTPDSLEIQLKRANLLTRLDRLDEASQTLRKLAHGVSADSSQYERIVETAKSLYLHRLLADLLEQMPASPETGIKIFQTRQKFIPEEAVSFAEAWLKKISDPLQKHVFTLGLARELFEGKQFAPAVSWVDKSLTFAGSPSLREESVLLKSDILAANDPQAAADWLQGSFKEQPEMISATLDRRLFRLFQRLDKSVSAAPVSTALDLRNILPKSDSEQGQQMQSYLNQLTEAASQPSATTVDFIRLARWQGWNEQPGQAARTLGQALKEARFEGSVPLHLEAAELAVGQERYSDAIELYKKLQTFDPENALAYKRALAGVFLADKQPGEAVEIFKNLAGADPQNPQLWKDLALAEEAGGFYFDAAKSWEKAHQLMMSSSDVSDGDKVQFIRPLAKVWRRLQRTDDATALYRSAMNEITDPTIRVLLEREVSGSVFKPVRVREENPRTSFSQNTAVTELQKIQSAAADGADAAEEWERLTERFPRDPEILEGAIIFYEKQKNFRQAAEVLEAKGRLIPASPRDIFRLASFWKQAGEFAKSLDLLSPFFAAAEFDKVDQASFPQIFDRNDAHLREVTNKVYYLRRNSGGWSRERGEIFKTFLDPQYIRPPALQNEMIQLVGSMVSYTPAEKEWLLRWDPQQLPEPGTAATFKERIAGLWALARWQRALDLLTLHLKRDPGDYDAVICFFEMAALSNQWQYALEALKLAGDNLSEWVDIFLASLGQAAASQRSHTRFDAEALQEALQADAQIARVLRWPVAQILAENSYRNAAVKIGEIALDSLSGQERSEAILAVTEWALLDYDLEAVRRITALPLAALNGDFTDPNLHILRIRWFVITPEEREAWEWKIKEALSSDSSLASVSLCAESVLTEALKTRNEKAPTELKYLEEKINALRDQLLTAGSFGNDFPTLAEWGSSGVEQFHKWNCPPAMEILAESVRFLDPALAELQGFSGELDYNWLDCQLYAIRLRSLSVAERRSMSIDLVSRLSEKQHNDISKILHSWGDYDVAMDFSFIDLSANKMRTALKECYKNAYALSDVGVLKMLNSILLEQKQPLADIASPKTLFFQRALLFLRTRDLKEAENAMKEVLTIDPQDEQAIGWESRFLWWRGDYREAIAMREKQLAARLTPETANFIITWTANLGDYEQTRTVLKSASEKLLPEQFSAVLSNYLTLFQETSLQAQAFGFAEHILLSHPQKFASSGTLLLSAYLSAGHPEEAFRFAEKMSTLFPPTVIFKNLEILVLDKKLPEDQRRQAEAELTSLFKKNASLENFRLHFQGKKLTRARHEDKSDEVSDIEKSLLAVWDSGKGVREAGLVLLAYYLEFKNTRRASEILDQFLQVELQAAEAEKLLQVCRKEDQPAFVTEILKSRLAAAPANLSLRLELANSLWQSGQKEAAEDTLADLQILREVLPGLSQDLAACESTFGNFSKAAELYLESAGQSNAAQRHSLLFLVAENFLKAGDKDSARKFLKEALLIPDDKLPNDLLGKFFAEEQRAQIADKSGESLPKHFAALDDELLQKLPDWVRQEVEVAFLERFLNPEEATNDSLLVQWQEAIFKLFENKPSLAVLPKGAEILNTCAVKTGQIERAEKIWKQALTIFPYPEARELAAKLYANHAGELVRRGARQEAFQFLKKISQQNPENAAIALSYADFLINHFSKESPEAKSFSPNTLKNLLRHPLSPRQREQIRAYFSGIFFEE